MRTNLTSDQIQDVISMLGEFLSEAKAEWDLEADARSSWLKISRGHIVQSTVFLLGITDSLIQMVEGVIPSGPDKKAAVLLAVANVFDYISSTFPIWLKPFVPLIKNIVVSIIISNLIEFIVKKYRSGAWKMGVKGGQQENVPGETNQAAPIRP